MHDILKMADQQNIFNPELLNQGHDLVDTTRAELNNKKEMLADMIRDVKFQNLKQ